MSTQQNQSFRPEAPKRRDTTTRRDPHTGDLIQEYSGNDNGPAMRTHYDWDAAAKEEAQKQAQKGQQQKPAPVKRSNTTISHNAAGDRIEEHDGEGSLAIRAMYNPDDEDTSRGGLYRGSSRN